MQKPAKLSTDPGVFIVVHGETKTAYVGQCNNLAHRFAVWKNYFKKREKDPKYKIPIYGVPNYPSREWTFMPFITEDIDKVRQVAERAGYKIINPVARKIHTFTIGGKTASLGEHVKDAGMSYHYVYHKVIKNGVPLEEVLKEGVKSNP